MNFLLQLLHWYCCFPPVFPLFHISSFPHFGHFIFGSIPLLYHILSTLGTPTLVSDFSVFLKLSKLCLYLSLKPLQYLLFRFRLQTFLLSFFSFPAARLYLHILFEMFFGIFCTFTLVFHFSVSRLLPLLRFHNGCILFSLLPYFYHLFLLYYIFSFRARYFMPRPNFGWFRSFW